MKNKLNPNARKWVRALRSGKYKQTKEVLHRVTKRGKKEVHTYCCLGVACELYRKSGKPLGKKAEYGTIIYADQQNFLPKKVMNWLGLDDDNGAIDSKDSLAARNDRGVPFSTIADVIVSKPEGLFAEGK